MALLPFQTIPNDWDHFFAEQIHQDLPDYLKSFYHKPLVGTQQSMQDTDFVAVDIETTGLNAQQDEIISIGLVPFDYHRIYLAQAKHWVIQSHQLTSESVVIHRITHSDLADAPSLRSLLPEIISHLAGKQIVVHYRGMEREFFRQAAAQLWQQNWLFPVIDTLELETQYLSKKQSLFAKWMQKPLASVRLLNARERYHLPAYENHNALVDALASAELLQAQIAKQKLADTPVRELWR
jgi:DNA polymerase-3 subunit epsilon